MNVQLSAEHREWLKQQVDAGVFPSVDAAIAIAIDDMMAIQEDPLAWSVPYLQEGEAALARGDTVTGDNIIARLDRRIGARHRQ